jgi:hypothetical protein
MTPVPLRPPLHRPPLEFLTTEGLPFTALCPARPIPASTLILLPPGLAARRLHQLLTPRGLRPCRHLTIFRARGLCHRQPLHLGYNGQAVIHLIS